MDADPLDPALLTRARAAAAALTEAALARVGDPQGRVRVEDYLATLAAATGEAALLASGVIDIETTTLVPGAPLFGDPINAVLSGDSLLLDALPPRSVAGLLVAELVPAVVSLDDFGSLERVYQHVAASVGNANWGDVATTVPEADRPRILPIREAFEMRDAVDAAQRGAGLATAQRHVPCTLALAAALGQVRGAIDLRVALTLSLEVTFGMAKMVPMSKAAFAAGSEMSIRGALRVVVMPRTAVTGEESRLDAHADADLQHAGGTHGLGGTHAGGAGGGHRGPPGVVPALPRPRDWRRGVWAGRTRAASCAARAAASW